MIVGWMSKILAVVVGRVTREGFLVSHGWPNFDSWQKRLTADDEGRIIDLYRTHRAELFRGPQTQQHGGVMTKGEGT